MKPLRTGLETLGAGPCGGVIPSLRTTLASVRWRRSVCVTKGSWTNAGQVGAFSSAGSRKRIHLQIGSGVFRILSTSYYYSAERKKAPTFTVIQHRYCRIRFLVWYAHHHRNCRSLCIWRAARTNLARYRDSNSSARTRQSTAAFSATDAFLLHYDWMQLDSFCADCI